MMIQFTLKPAMALCCFLLLWNGAYTQNFVNGDLEINTSPGCNWNMTNSSFNSMMNGVTAFGLANEVDIQETVCGYSSAQNGDYFISIHQQDTGITDEVSFVLTSPVIAGNTYAISYYDQANTLWDSPGRIQVGLSTSPTDFGTVIHSSYPEVNNWTEQKFTFTAPFTASYITVRVWNEESEPDPTSWIFIDNFSFTCPFASLGDDFVLCEGDSFLLDAAVSNAIVTWQDGSGHLTYTVTEPGTYWVTINYGNCQSSDTIVVSGANVKMLSLGNDTTICKEKSLLLTANVAQADYKWHDGSAAQNCLVKGPGIYWVTVTSNGCSNTDTITVEEMDCAPDIEMPNVFTPNGDGLNDLFRPIVMKNIASGSLIIWNRWGDQLYMTDDPDGGWDGNNRGTACSEGIYFWVAECTDIFGGTSKLTGTVTLLR